MYRWWHLSPATAHTKYGIFTGISNIPSMDNTGSCRSSQFFLLTQSSHFHSQESPPPWDHRTCIYESRLGLHQGGETPPTKLLLESSYYTPKQFCGSSVGSLNHNWAYSRPSLNNLLSPLCGFSSLMTTLSTLHNHSLDFFMTLKFWDPV